MLAYTTVSDILYVPSALEVAVYFGGLLLVLALPTAYVTIKSMRDDKKDQQQTRGSELN